MSKPKVAFVHLFACLATPMAVLAQVKIIAGQGMPAFAFWLCALFSCSGSLSWAMSDSAPQVLFAGNGFEVSRVNASVNATQVIDMQVFRDVSEGYFVAHAVGKVSAAFAVYSDPHGSVTGRDNSANPQPAAGVRLWDVFRIEPVKHVRAVHSLMITQLRNYKGETNHVRSSSASD